MFQIFISSPHGNWPRPGCLKRWWPGRLYWFVAGVMAEWQSKSYATQYFVSVLMLEELISLSHGRQLFQMFTRLFHMRTKNLNSRVQRKPKPDNIAEVSDNNNNNNHNGTASARDNGDLTGARPFTSKRQEAAHEDEWLLPLVLVCRENYYFSQHYGMTIHSTKPVIFFSFSEFL